MLNFLFGFYCAGATCAFTFVGFFCLLGGQNKDLWKPFVFAFIWPISVPVIFSKWALLDQKSKPRK